MAILLLSVDSKLAAQIFRVFTKQQIHEVTQEMTRLTYVEDSLRAQVMAKHLGVDLTPELLARPDLLSHLTAALEAYIRTDPNKAARSFELLLAHWIRRPAAPESSVEQASKVSEELTPGQEAAVVFMSLPPEISAQLFSHLDARTIEAVTLEITRLPQVFSHMRMRAVGRFLDIPTEGRSVDHMIKTLEAVVAADPKRAAELIASTWPEIDKS